MKFKITDTAGIRATENLIEKIGISKSIEKINYSDFYTNQKSSEKLRLGPKLDAGGKPSI